MSFLVFVKKRKENQKGTVAEISVNSVSDASLLH